MDKRIVLFPVIGGLLALSGLAAHATSGPPPISSAVPSTINQAKGSVAVAGSLADGVVHGTVSQTAGDVTQVQGQLDKTLGGSTDVDPALINGETSMINMLLNSTDQTLTGTIDGVTATVAKTLDGVSATVTSTTNGVTSTITKTFNASTGLLTTVSKLTGGATDGVSQTVTSAGDLVTALTGSL